MLYFDNLSPDTADAYLADGLTEELIAHVGRIDRLAVASRYVVRRHRGSPLAPAALGRALGVSHLVTGSVRRAGTRLRVAVELLRTQTGARLWGEQYDRTDADLLDIQEGIARAVASAVAGRLLPRERRLLAARATQHPQAYDHFLKGNHLLAQRTARAMAQAIAEYEAAVRLDSGFADARARTALAYAVFIDWGWSYPGLPAESLLVRGLGAAERALRRDSASSDAWMAQGYLLAYRHPRTLEGVREAFARAIALDPRNAEAHHQYGWILALLGDASGAVEASRRALALEPERPVTLHQLALVSLASRRFADARQWLDSALVLSPGYSGGYGDRAGVHLVLGDTGRARADLDMMFRLGGDTVWGHGILALLDAAQGDTVAARARAETVARAVGDPDPQTPTVAATLAAALVAAGQPERALDVLDRAKLRGAHLWFWFQFPLFDPIRSHPRFLRLVEESRPPGAPPL